MDGFSPPPMSDFSPPPMEDLSPLNDFPPPMNGFSPPPDDEEDDADNHFDFDISDTSYDLTGLSEKMNSLEFDKIKNLPPREILELKKESSELNNLYSNNLKVEPPEQHMVQSENNNEGTTDHKLTNGDVNVSLTVIDNGNDAFSEDELQVNNTDINGDITPMKSNLSEEVAESKALQDDDSMENDVCESYLPDLSPSVVKDVKDEADEIPTDKFVESDPSVASDKIETKFVESDDDEDLFEKPTVWDDPPKPLPSSQINLPKQPSPTFSEDINHEKDLPPDDEWGEFPDESKQETDQASWGNFEEGPESGQWGDFDNSSIKPEIANDRTKLSEVRDIEFDDFSDDEFGDFGEADVKPNAIPEPVKVPEVSLSSQLERLDGVGENLINSVYGGKCKALNAEEESSDLDLEKDVLGDSEVFQPMENPALTPGLDYKWRDSATYTIMLNTLGIDSRVVLDGENWRSSVPRYAPKNAATLLTPGLLTPEPVTSPGENKEELGQEIKDPGNGGVTPAEFDWNNSGLTNPLEENGLSEANPAIKSSETPKVITELLAAQNNPKLAEKKSVSILQKHTSREAKNILDGFPLLNFMTSSVLMFPTKSIDKKKGRPKPD